MTVLFSLIATVSVCVAVVVCIAYRRLKLTIKHNLDYFDHLNDRVPINAERKYPKLYRGV